MLPSLLRLLPLLAESTSCAVCASNKSAPWSPSGIGRAIGVLRRSIAHAGVILAERWARTALKLCRHYQRQLRSGPGETGNAARWVSSNASFSAMGTTRPSSVSAFHVKTTHFRAGGNSFGM